MVSKQEITDLESSTVTNPNAPQNSEVKDEHKPSLIWRMIVGTGTFTRWLVTTFLSGLYAGVKFTIIFDFAFFYGIRAIMREKP